MNTALLHFIWQGAAIAFLLAVALVFVKSARARYAWACTALLAMPVAFALTLALLQPVALHQISIPLLPFPVPVPAVAGGAMVAQRWSPDPTSLWMAGAALLYGYRALGWLAAQRLRRRGVCVAPVEWQERLAALSDRIHNTRPVQLLESALAETPITIGLWRPVILMPLGLLAGLPSAQVEAILLHELAHIRRHDYLVNLLQAFVEGLLFYHPAVWWVSRVIRREREMCCDDLALAATGDVLTYTRALAALEQRRVPVPMLAVTGGPLMQRIQRLLGRPCRVSPIPALLFLALAASVAIYAFEPAPLPDPVPAPAPAPVPAPAPAPAPQPEPAPQAPAVPPAAPAPARPQSVEERRDFEARLAQQLETPYKKWLNEEVVWIITPNERSAFQRLETDDERQMFIEQFWLRRDPTPDTNANEFKDEHYRRIALANDRFGHPGLVGWKSDRGMVYVKFGPPDEREEHPNGGEASPAPYEKWRYRYLEGVGNDVMVEFVDDTGQGRYRMTWNPNDKNGLLAVPHNGLKDGLEVPPQPVQQNMFDRLQRFIPRPRPAQ